MSVLDVQPWALWTVDEVGRDVACQVFRARPSQIAPRPAYQLLEQVARHEGKTADQLLVERRAGDR